HPLSSPFFPYTTLFRSLKPEVLAVKVAGRSIAETADLSLDQTMELVNSIELTEREAQIAAQVLREIRVRLEFLLRVGLNYLTLRSEEHTSELQSRENLV